MALELQPGQVFKVMEVAYRKGVMDKFMPLQGEVLKKVKERTGFGMAELSNMMNEAPEKSLKRIDMGLRYAGPFLRLAANETLMGLASRLLDLEMVKRAIVLTNIILMERMVARNRGKNTPPTGNLPGGGE